MDEEERNYCCLAILLTRVGVCRLRDHFISKWNDDGTYTPWTDCVQNGTDILLSGFRPLSYEQDKVKSGDTTRWDLSLLVRALLNTWPPMETSPTLLQSLNCLKDTRNTLCHTSDGKIATADFTNLWNAVCNALGVFGATSDDFQKVEQDVMLPLNELTSLMKQCAKQDDEIIHGFNTILEKLEQGLHEIKQGQEKNKEEIKEMFKDGLDQVKKMHYNCEASSTRQAQLSTEDVQLRSKYLKTSAKHETEFQPKLISSHSIASAKTNEIFTNLMMQHGRKSLPTEGASRKEQLSEYSTPSGTPIERSQDIFISQDKGTTHPKCILVTGKAGIGKSIFCQKLVRDWADDVLFEEELQTKTHGFDFVYLLPFRQLNVFDNEQLTLMELLNRCSLLDERSNIDEQLFEYMIEHQEKVLFILDGYDEYKERESITTNCVDQKHESNPRVAMPVAALLSKLLKGKIFGEAVVMVTSRPTESNELGGINFDALVEINGFSSRQVKEFIGKYFQSNSQMKNAVLRHVMANEDLKSLAHVPMFCFLMCWCMEWNIKNTTDQDLPVNMTELYSEVVKIFELKHNSKSQYRGGEIPEQLTEFPAVVKSTLEKLSKLAVETMKKTMFNFEEKELMNIGLSSEEIGDLKLSGLLTSGPGLRTSATTITRYYSFSHLTLHEYFTARWYVDNGKVPSLKEIDSEMVFQFFSGLSAKAENGEELMEQLLILINKGWRQNHDHDLKKLLVPLLYVYGDKGFGLKMIEKHLFRLLFCSDENLSCNKDCNICIFYLDLLNLSCETHDELVQNVPSDEIMVCKVCLPFRWCCDVSKRILFGETHNELVTNVLSDRIMVYKVQLFFVFNVSQTNQLCEALTNSFSPITSLRYSFDSQDNFDILCEALPSTKINEVEIYISSKSNLIISGELEISIRGEVDLMSLRKAVLDTNSKVKSLILVFFDNSQLFNLEHLSQEVGRSKRDIKIKIDVGVSLNVSEMKQLCKALTYSSSPITSLKCDVDSQDSLDVLCDALPSTNINELKIEFENDVDLMSLRKALLDTNCKVKDLTLEIDDEDEDMNELSNNLKHLSQEVGRSKADMKIYCV